MRGVLQIINRWLLALAAFPWAACKSEAGDGVVRLFPPTYAEDLDARVTFEWRTFDCIGISEGSSNVCEPTFLLKNRQQYLELQVTDFLCQGDRFEAYVAPPSGSDHLIFQTSKLPESIAPCTRENRELDPSAAFRDSRFSSASRLIPPGDYQLKIRVLKSQLSSSKGAVRLARPIGCFQEQSPHVQIFPSHDGTHVKLDPQLACGSLNGTSHHSLTFGGLSSAEADVFHAAISTMKHCGVAAVAVHSYDVDTAICLPEQGCSLHVEAGEVIFGDSDSGEDLPLLCTARRPQNKDL